MNEPITLTNPHDGEKWTSGKRGRKPKWVTEMLEGKVPTKIEEVVKVAKEPSEKKVAAEKPVEVKVEPTSFCWWYKGEDDDSGVNYGAKVRCFVHAKNFKDALALLSATFSTPVTQYELQTKWKVGSDAALTHNGRFGVWNYINGQWVEREAKKRA